MAAQRNNKYSGVVAALALAAGTAQAAGGHHGVDDASILLAGECAQESWLLRADGGQQRLHLGFGCGIGPVELGLAAEHHHGGGEPSRTYWAPELKWARELAPGFSIGFDVSPVYQADAGSRYAGTSAYAIASWLPHPALALHFNYGRDFQPDEADQPRAGIALEWQAAAHWSLVAERYREQATHFARAGVRWAAGRSWSLDLSRAQRIAGPLPSHWTFGLNLAFGG